MKTTYSISINQTDDQGQPVGNLSMTTTDQADLMRLLANAGIGHDSPEEKWSDDPADQGVCPVCSAKPCGCNEEVEEDYANEPKPEVVSTSGGNEFGEQRPQQDQRQVTARQGDNPIKKEDIESLAKTLEEQYLKEWASELDEAGYSAKAARAGKDIGKPGKAFAQIAKDAGERYGSKERGEKVAGAVLKNLRAKEDVQEDQVDEEPNEGNEFSGALAKAKAAGAKEFEVDGKTYQVKEGKKPDFLDLDKDGDKEEPMDKAADEKEDKEEVKESSAELDYLKAIINWSPKQSQVKTVTDDMINQGTVNSELDWLKAVVKYQPK